MGEIPLFYQNKLKQLSKKYEVPLDTIRVREEWDSQNPSYSYKKIKDEIRDLSPQTIDIESSEMYRNYLQEQRERDWERKDQEIKKVEEKIKKQRKSHVIHVTKGKKHYPFTIYVNGKVLSYSPTKSHATEIKNNFIAKIRQYNTHERDQLMIPSIQIKRKRGFKTIKGF